MQTNNIDFSQLIQPIAEHFWGEPSKKGKKPRWGRNGSKTIDPIKGTYYDFEAAQGGGLLDLVRVEIGLADNSEAVRWLADNGWIEKQSATPEQRQKARARAKTRFEQDASYHRLMLVRIEKEAAKGPLTPEHEALRADALRAVNELAEKHGVIGNNKTKPAHQAVNACYKHRVLCKPNTLADAATDTAMPPKQVAQHFQNHLQWKYAPLHNSIKPSKKFSRFSKVLEGLKKGKSAFVQAPQGTGKTRSLAKPLIEHTTAQGRPVIALTVLRSLANQNADALELGSDRDDKEVIAVSEGISTTLHGLSTEHLMPLIADVAIKGGLLVIDEAAKVAGLLASNNPILSGEQKSRLLAALKGLARHSEAQILALDADVTPETAALLQTLGMKDAVLEVTERPHALPEVEFHPIQYNPEGAARPLLDEIKTKLQAGEQCVIASATRRDAETLHEILRTHCTGKNLLLTSKTTGLPEQTQFLSDPDAAAPDYQLIVYSPVLSAGFSVVSVEPHIYATVGHDHLQAPEILQLIRRFRRPAGGVIRVEVPQHLQSATQLYNPDITADILSGTRADIDSLHFFERAQIASLQQRNLNASNPFYAMAGHFENSGIRCRVTYSNGGLEAGAESANAREQLKEREVEDVAAAPEVELLELAYLEQSGANTPDAWAKLERHKITQALILNYSDLEPDGTLPRDLVQGCLHERLAQRVANKALLMLEPADLLFLSINQDARRRFAFKKNLSAQIQVARRILADAGEHFTGEQAREIANRYREEIKSHWHLLSKPPTKGKGNKAFVAWLKNVLHKFGFRVKSVRTAERRKNMVINDVQVNTYATRKAAKIATEIGAEKAKIDAKNIENKKFQKCSEKPLEAA